MKSVLSPNPVFNPSTKTLSFSGIPGFISNRLMVVLDQTTNNVIYAEGIAGLGGTWDAGKRVLTLQLDTTVGGYASTDQLQVVYDAPVLVTKPEPEAIDPVGKARVSNPQALIDTDFEYGLQPTKWEFVQQVNNKPTFWYDTSQPIPLVGLSGSGVRQVSAFITSVSGLIATNTLGSFTTATQISLPNIGQPIYIQDAFDPNANGFYYIDAVYRDNPSLPINCFGMFTYTAKGPVSGGNILESTRTAIFSAFSYSNSYIPLCGIFFDPSNTSVSVTAVTVSAHNLHTGDQIYVLNVPMNGRETAQGYASHAASSPAVSLSSSGPAGAWIISSTPNRRTLIFNTYLPVSGFKVSYLNPWAALPTSTVFDAPPLTGAYLFPRPNGFSIHRPFDGGVQFSCGPYTPNAQKIRQTRRYFRYQSGKGIQFSTGTILEPSFNVDQLTADGTTVTVFTKNIHGMTPGSQITVSGSAIPEYNGTFTITGVPNDTSLTYTAGSAPGVSPAVGFPIFVSASSWYNNNIRIGLFDSQNGVFFEYDGQHLYAVRRNSINQLAGNASVTNGSPLVIGTNTRFIDQLLINDHIVIRGSTYKVTNIMSQTAMTISPEYKGSSVPLGNRGGAANGVIISKVIDTRIRRDSWNIDKLDGTGPSGYTIDITKMQMFYIDYSWYGAGFIRWGVRATNGDIVYCHKMANNNINTEAFMRSGNLPARYEVGNIPLQTYLDPDVTFASGDTTMQVVANTLFPSQGTLRVTGNGDNAPIEYVSYTGKGTSPVSFTGLTRARPGGATSATTFVPASTAPVLVELHSNSTTQPVISSVPAAVCSHWGSSVIMDGRFDEDISYSFNAGNLGGVVVGAGSTFALMSIRLGPTVDSSRIGALGAKEVINRMQLKLKSLDVATAQTTSIWRILINLNGRINTNANTIGLWQPAGGSSLAQVCFYGPSNNVTVAGGENIFGFFFQGGSGTYQQDLTQVKELGNSILGGGFGSRVSTTLSDVYPDGPDVIHILAQNLVAGGTIYSRLSWTEAQA